MASRSQRYRWLVGIVFLMVTSVSPAQGDPSLPSAVSKLEQELHTLRAGHADTSSDGAALVRLADLYLDLGDEYREDRKRRAAYEEGARMAQRAIGIEPSNAEAHYLYAANLGSAAQLKGVMASALTINEIKAHVRRALELKPNHAPALHMMGMMLEELPWFMGGDAEGAMTYLNRAVVADPYYTHARLDLAKTYLKRRNPEAARRELTTILSREPSPGRDDERYRAEARRLLAALER